MITSDPRILRQVAEQLGNYVYLLIDPRDSTPFYVGKGVGTRMLQHGIDAEQLTAGTDEAEGEGSRKLRRIREIRESGAEPTIWVLRYGLTSSEYTAVEAAAIDLLMSLPVVAGAAGQVQAPLAVSQQLTNARREASRGSGITTLAQLVDDLAAPPLETSEPLLLITLNGWGIERKSLPGGGERDGYGFKRAWLDRSTREAEINVLADSTRCWWRIDPRRVEERGIRYAVAVHAGVTRALFRIVPGSWVEGEPGRRGFDADPVLSGPLHDAVVGMHGRRVPPKLRGDQSQFNYWPR